MISAAGGGLYVTQTVTWGAKQILSNKVFVLSSLSIWLD